MSRLTRERERVARAVVRCEPELGQPPVGDMLEVAAHVGHRHPGHPAAEQVLGERGLRVDGLGEHLLYLGLELLVDEVGLFRAHGARDIEGEVHVHRLVAEHPVGPGRQPVQQPPGAQEVHVGERAVEEQPFDAGGEADQVEQERAPVVAGAQLVQVGDGVDPAVAELRLGADRGDVPHRRERLGPLLGIGDVGVEQGQVELDVHGLLEQLPGQVEPGFGGVDVLVEVEHQVVRDDRVAGGEERHEPVSPDVVRPG